MSPDHWARTLQYKVPVSIDCFIEDQAFSWSLALAPPPVPLPPPSVSSTGDTQEDGRWWEVVGEEESLALYKSFSTLWLALQFVFVSVSVQFVCPPTPWVLSYSGLAGFKAQIWRTPDPTALHRQGGTLRNTQNLVLNGESRFEKDTLIRILRIYIEVCCQGFASVDKQPWIQ